MLERSDEARYAAQISSELNSSVSLKLLTLGSIGQEEHIAADMAAREQTHDPVNTYTSNSRQGRGPEWSKTPDIITLGCSHSWGTGVPDDAVWSKVLSEQTGMSYVNLAMPGYTIQQNLNDLLVYIKDYGKPKYVVALFPDFTRTYTLIRHDLMAEGSGGSSGKEVTGDELSFTPVYTTRINDRGSDAPRPKILKRPFSFPDVVSKETFLFYYMQYLSMMQIYCEAAGIKFLFSTWDAGTLTMFRKYKDQKVDLPGFCDLGKTTPTEGSDTIYRSNCHPSKVSEYGKNWLVGADATEGRGGHIGIHEHLDIAEMFANEIKNTRID